MSPEERGSGATAAAPDRQLIERIENALSSLLSAIKNATFYPPRHPLVMERINKTYEMLSEVLGERKELSLGFVEGELVFEKMSLPEASIFLKEFISEMQKNEVASLVFSQGLRADEVAEFVDLLATKPELLAEKEKMEAEFLARGISHIVITKAAEAAVPVGIDQNLVKLQAREIYDEALNVIKGVMEDVRLGRAIEVEKVKGVVYEIMDNLAKDSSALLGLTWIKSYDDYTFNHSVNVGILCLAFGQSILLGETQLVELGLAALLHDVGKVLVPLEVLNKAGKLSDEEWKLMKQHPVAGAKILRKAQGLSALSPVIAYEHHLKYDLSGYPSLVKKRDLNLYSMIVSIADCYDALTTVRPYRDAFTPGEALQIMTELVGKDFEPRLFKRFVEMLGVYPVGSFVRLDTNEFGVVLRLNREDKSRPWVRLIIDEKGQRISEPIDVNLMEKDDETGEYKRSIVQCLDPFLKGVTNLTEILEKPSPAPA